MMEIGIDCVEIERFERCSVSDAFVNKVYTKNEITYCESKSKSCQHYAARFAAKEAAIKALSNFNIVLKPNDIEILNDEKGYPYLRIEKVKSKNIIAKVSISHSNTIAVAIVLIEKQQKSNP